MCVCLSFSSSALALPLLLSLLGSVSPPFSPYPQCLVERSPQLGWMEQKGSQDAVADSADSADDVDDDVSSVSLPLSLSLSPSLSHTRCSRRASFHSIVIAARDCASLSLSLSPSLPPSLNHLSFSSLPDRWERRVHNGAPFPFPRSSPVNSFVFPLSCCCSCECLTRRCPCNCLALGTPASTSYAVLASAVVVVLSTATPISGVAPTLKVRSTLREISRAKAHAVGGASPIPPSSSSTP